MKQKSKRTKDAYLYLSMIKLLSMIIFIVTITFDLEIVIPFFTHEIDGWHYGTTSKPPCLDSVVPPVKALIVP